MLSLLALLALTIFCFIKDNKTPLQDPPTWSLVLALSICYHARLQDRNGFEEGVVQQFGELLALTGGVQQFKDEIRW